MKRWFMALLIFVSIPCSGVMAADGSQEYVLHSGDVLSINVTGYPDLSFPQNLNGRGITIGLDGKFTYPFLGEVDTKGLSAGQLARHLSERLEGMYVNAVVSVNIMRYGKERIYVLGEVNRPGSFELDKVRTLLDAIGAASGWRTDAAKTKVFIIRKDQNGKPPIKVNLMALLEQGDTRKNYLLREGDVVFLTGSHRIDLAADLLPLVNAAYQLAKFRDKPDSPDKPDNPEKPDCP